jgi:1,4-alpha-glucan branching enzyme
MRKAFLWCISMLIILCSDAQLLTWTPLFPVEDDATTSVVINMDASKGNRGLFDHTPSSDVYVHTGVITNKSTSANDWKYVKFNQNFNQPNPALNATYLGNNQWRFTITGSLRSYYGITDATENIQKIAILFRSGNGSKKQANTDGSDMYIPIYTSSIAVRITEPPLQPTYKPIPEPIQKLSGDNINIAAVANKSASLKLFVNGVMIRSNTNSTSIADNYVLTQTGNTRIIAEADDGVAISRDTIDFFVAPGINIAPLPVGVKQGINYEAGNTAVTLVLFAPLKNRVSIIGDLPGSNWVEQPQYQMNKTADGKIWWLRITGLTPGTEYSFQYLVDGTLKIADPYVEKVLDNYNNNDQNISPSTYPGLKPYPTGLTSGIVGILQTAPPAYNWKVNNFNRPDKRSLVIYELLLRDFVEAHDWKTLKDSLNYLKNLGINAIELMPFNEFEGNNSWGYNPDFYFAPDKYYGPKNSLKEFIDSCHSKGIAVIMDIALNHSFGLSPMVQLYFDNANNRPSPDNPWFNPVTKHAFNVGYDMNHESLDTRYFTGRVVEHWLKEYKIDGFRFDLSKGFTQTATCDNNGNNCNVNAWSNYDAGRVAIWKRYFDTVQSKSSDAYVILEHFATNSEEKELADYGMLFWGNHNHNFSQATMGFSQDWNFEGGIFTQRGWTKPHLITYMESHDEERIMYKNLQFGNSSGSYNIKDLNTALRRTEMSATFLLSIPGPKMIWQFGELGYDYSINHCPNGTVNNNCRLDPKPIRWDYLQITPRKRLHDIYASVLKLRVHPQYKAAFMSDKVTYSLGNAVKWIKLTTDTSNLLLVGNFGVTAADATITFQNPGTWYNYLDATTFTATGNAQTISLQPGQYHLFLNRNVVNAVTTPVSNLPSSSSLLQLMASPNPVQNLMNIRLTMPETGTANLSLLNLYGQKIREVKNGFLIKGQHSFELQSQHYPPGTYFLQLQTKNATSTIKIILQ